MQLSMTVLRCPDQVAPEARTVAGGEFHIGRGPDVDWVLPDPDRLLSKRHFAVAFRGGAWQVADTSTNGTYLNTEPEPIGRGALRSLRDGDRLRLGAYKIEIRLVDQPVRDSGGGGFAVGGIENRPDQNPFGDPFREDPLAPSPAARRPFDEPAYPDQGLAPTGARLPHDFDPLAPDRDDAGFAGDFSGPVQFDHASSMQDAIIPPPIAGYSAPHTGGIIPGDDLLPDDWDKDLLEGIAPPSKAAIPIGASEPARPIARDPRSAPVDNPPVSAPAARAIPSPVPEPLDFSEPPAAPRGVPPEPVDFRDPRPVRSLEQDPFAPIAPAGLPDRTEPPVRAAPPAEEQRPPPTTSVAPVVRQRAPRPATPGPAPAGLSDPFTEGEERQAREPSSTPAAPPAEIAASPFDEPSDPSQGAPAASPVAPARSAPVQSAPAQTAPVQTAPVRSAPVRSAPVRSALADPASLATDDGDLLTAFFRGAELNGAAPADPSAMMNGLGQAFRALVAGLRTVLIARATIKSEFRIEQTMIRARGNNPLKFSANDDDALIALLGVGRRTDMAPAAAIEDSLRDLRLHELATMAAMQVAVRALLDEFGPEKIRAASDHGGMTVLPAQRKARAWDAFEARHAAVTQALVDDFDSIFGKTFARAYEKALDEISMRERQ